jgi:hypothetical protein
MISGTERPSLLAVLRLISVSTKTACSQGYVKRAIAAPAASARNDNSAITGTGGQGA